MEEDRKTEAAFEEAEETDTVTEAEAGAAPESGENTPEEGTENQTAEDADEEEAMDAGFTSVEDEKKGSLFRRREKKDKKDEKIEELTDRLQRQMAEFDNYRKRTDKEKTSMYDMGARDTIEKILPVVDNFERGLAGADAGDPFADGIQKIYKQLMTVLTDLGVTPIEAEGKPFDPNFHNAVMHEDDPEAGENIVTQELQKGYMYKDTVLRYSMVKVAN